MSKKSFVHIRTFMVVIVFILAFTLNYTYAVPGPEGSIIDKIKASGKIIVGTSADYPPYEFHLLNDPEGELVGIDVDIAKVIADELGVKLVINDLIFSRIFKALEMGEIDIAIAGLHPTAERKKIADFSDIYYQAMQNIIIKAEDAEKIKLIEDLRGMKVGIQKDSIQEDMARTQIIGAEFVVRETIEELIINLRKGLVAAVILEKPVADSYVRRNKNFKSIQCKSFDHKLGSAIAVKQGNHTLLKEINRILAKLKKEDKIKEFVENAKMLTNKR